MKRRKRKMTETKEKDLMIESLSELKELIETMADDTLVSIDLGLVIRNA